MSRRSAVFVRGRRGVIAALVVGLVVAAGGCTDEDPEVADPTTMTAPSASDAASGESPGRLYVQRGGGGASDIDDRGAGTLTLTQVDADTVWFQDRPGRASGRMTTSDFVGEWASAGFAADPPNAALEISTPVGPSASHVLELSNPRWDETAATLTYDVQLAATDGEVLPAEFDAASLFIDDGTPSGAAAALSLQFSNVDPGQVLRLQLAAPDGGQVAFSSSPGPDGSAGGLQLQSDADPVPLEQLELGEDELVIQTSSASGSGSLTFSVQLFLVAGAAPDVVSLMSSSDPGVEITAALGNAQPQVVNSSATLFTWPA